MIELTDTGLAIDSLQENLDEVKAEFRAAISPVMDLEETSLMGQYIAVVMNQLQKVKEAAQHEYGSMDPDQAAGASLDRLVRLVGVERLGARRSVARVIVTLAAGSYPAGSLVAHVVGDPELRFYNAVDINTAAGGDLVNQLFFSEEPGPIRAPSGTLTVIANPVIGFLAITNPLDAELGFLQETDQALRTRWRSQLARMGSGTVDAIRADVLQVANFVRVYENDTDFTNAEGLPPHSFETMVLGGDNPVIAQAIFDTKPAGIRAYGQINVAVVDQQGAGHNIGFSRPTEIKIYLRVEATYLAGHYLGNDAMKNMLLDWGNNNLGPGNDVIHNRLVQLVMDQPGVVDSKVFIGITPSPSLEQNYVIGVREIARFDSSRMEVVTFAVTVLP